MPSKQKWHDAVATIALAMLPVCIGSGLGAGAAWESARDRARPTVGISGDRSLTLVGARGDELSFYLRGESVGGGKWATSGLALEFDGDRIEVVPPREQDWDDTLTGGLGEFKINGTFTVPDLPGAEKQIVAGAIVGSVLLPQPSGEREFENESETLDVPVELHLTSPAEADSHMAAAQGLMPRLVPILIAMSAGSAALGIVLALVAGRLKRKYGLGDLM